VSDDPIADLRRALVRTAVRRQRPWWRRRPSLLGLLAVVLVAAPATAAVDRLWKPDVPPVAPMRTVTAKATPPVAARASAGATADCDAGTGVVRSTTRATPPARLLGALSVLRAPETPDDRAGRRAARRLGMPGIAVRHVRTLGRDASGDRRWIAPRLVAVDARPATASCPARRRVRQWSFAAFGEHGGGAEYAASQIQRSGTLGASGTGRREATVAGIVPDGVAQVEVSYGRAAARTWPVRRNFFSFRVRLPVEHAYRGRVTWKDAAGRVIPHTRIGGGP
jgi:hypothetical protein